MRMGRERENERERGWKESEIMDREERMQWELTIREEEDGKRARRGWEESKKRMGGERTIREEDGKRARESNAGRGPEREKDPKGTEAEQEDRGQGVAQGEQA